MTSGFVRRMVAGDLFQFKDGYLKLMDIPCYLWSLQVLVITHLLLSKEMGSAGRSLLFRTQEIQSMLAARMMEKRMGLKDVEAIKRHLEQGEMIGAGVTKLVRADLSKPEFIIRVDSTFAKEYRQTLGIQKHPVDDMARGAFAGLLKVHTGNDDLLCVETQCMAMGKPACHFIVKPMDQWDLKDPSIVYQLTQPLGQEAESFLGKKLGFPVRRTPR